MSNDKKNNKKKPDKKGSLSSYWFYAILIVVLLGMNTVMSVISKPKVIGMKQFAEIAASNDFDKVKVINRENVHMYIKEESLSKYADIKTNNKLSTSMQTPHYSMQIGSVDHFAETIDKLNSVDRVHRYLTSVSLRLPSLITMVMSKSLSLM